MGLYTTARTDIPPEAAAIANRVCPFSDEAADESELAAARFPGLAPDPVVGRYRAVLAGRVNDGEMLSGSSSGGLLTFVLENMLATGLVDGVIHVGRSSGQALFKYQVSDSVEAIRGARKSAYYATTLAECLHGIRASNRKHVIVGVPCFIKAARLLAAELPDINERLVWYVGIVCGHMKGHFFAQSLAWQAGVLPADLASIDFRVKNAGLSSHLYNYAVTDREGTTRTKRVGSTIDGSWAIGAFQPEACNFCDDIFAEAADVAFGDAWLPRYTQNSSGTSLLVVRHEEVLRILRQAAPESISLDDLGAAEAISAQSGGVRHRRDGLRVRLADDIAAGLRVPKKRVKPGYEDLSLNRIALIRQRRQISRATFELFAEALQRNDFQIYRDPLLRAIHRYLRLEGSSQGLRGIARYVVRRMTMRI